MEFLAPGVRRGGAAVAAALAVLLAGCGGGGEAREENHPMMRRALALKHANDTDGAIAAYTRHLDRNPGTARAHLQLAMLCDQEPREDFVRAVYHYERYLELGRDEKTREYVAELLKRARMSYAASLPDRPSEAIRIIADLKQENAALREQIATLQRSPAPATRPAAAPPAPATARSVRPSVPAAPAPATGATGAPPRATTSLARPAPAPAVSQAQTYTVQPGDTLSVIAAKVYGDPNAWRRIYEANQGLLPDAGSVRPQQVLVIPR